MFKVCEFVIILNSCSLQLMEKESVLTKYLYVLITKYYYEILEECVRKKYSFHI